MTLAPPRANAAWVFAGQGTLRRELSAAAFDRFPELVERAEAILGWSLREYCLGADDTNFARTRYAQPAIFVLGAIDYLDRLARAELRPRFLAGHSLGELVALFCAGAYDFETGLRIVARRGELSEGANPGGMIAVLGLPAQRIAMLLPGEVSIAADNTPSQVTIAGPRPALARAVETLESEGAETVSLDIAGAYHCALMAHVAERFREFLEPLALRDPLVPVLAHAYARPYYRGEVRDGIVAQLTAPVRWRECVEWLLAEGVEDFVELGGTTLLAKMVAHIRAEAA